MTLPYASLMSVVLFMSRLSTDFELTAMHAAGIPTLAMALPLLFIAPRAGVALGAAGLGLQLLGHAVEGNAPLFVGDPRFVLVGAAWFTEELRARLAGRRP